MSTAKNAPTDHIATQLLSRAHSPPTTNTLFRDKIVTKPLLLRPTSPPLSDRRSASRLARLRKKEHFLAHQKPRPLSAKQKRVLGVYEIPKEERRYEVFEGLHGLWVGYMWEVLELKGGGGARVIKAQGHGSKLASADYHGAEVEVVRSGCVSRVGIKGIVVRDTRFTFVVITKRNELKTIPKKDTIFRFEVPLPEDEEIEEAEKTEGQEEQQKGEKEKRKPLVFELHGNQFESRPADRANKKFKWRPMDYI